MTGRHSRSATLLLLTAATACGTPKTPSGGDSAPAIEVADTAGGSLVFKFVNGSIKEVGDTMPKCPVTAHYDGTVTLTHMSGTLRYRWERGTGDSSVVTSVAIPAAAKTGSADVDIKADEWLVNTGGVQTTVHSRLHLLGPMERYSPQVDLEVRCYQKE